MTVSIAQLHAAPYWMPIDPSGVPIVTMTSALLPHQFCCCRITKD
jgi:hypothetical protein